MMACIYIFLAAILVAKAYGENVHEMKVSSNHSFPYLLKVQLLDPQPGLLLSKQVGQPFTWSNCNKTAAILAFRSLSVSPHPIQFGRPLILSFNMEVTNDIGTIGPVKADIDAKMVYQGQEYDMCSYGEQYCHVSDFCKLIQPYKSYCPEPAKKIGFDCQCPLKKSTYAIKDMFIPLPQPTVTIEGTFHVTVHLTEADRPLGCLDVILCLGECTS